MSMVLSFRSVSPEEIKRIEESPETIIEIIYPEDELERAEENKRQLYIDKAWHGIHYLISEENLKGEYKAGTPLSNVIMGGKEIGEDVGYGPAHLILPEDVKDSSEALQKITGPDLQKAFKPEDMENKEIYPDIWVRDGEEALQYLLFYFVKLRDYYKDTADKGYGMLTYLS